MSLVAFKGPGWHSEALLLVVVQGRTREVAPFGAENDYGCLTPLPNRWREVDWEWVAGIA